MHKVSRKYAKVNTTEFFYPLPGRIAPTFIPGLFIEGDAGREKIAGRRGQEDRSHPGKLAPVPPRRGWGAQMLAKAPSGEPGGTVRRAGFSSTTVLLKMPFSAPATN